MEEPSPPTPGHYPADTRDLVQAAEKTVSSALGAVGGQRGRMYRLDAEDGTFRCVVSIGGGRYGRGNRPQPPGGPGALGPSDG